jgi:hypothetical protein
MQRRRFAHAALVAVIASIVSSRAAALVSAARGNSAADGRPGAETVVLGAVSTVAAPGHQIRLVRRAWSPTAAPRIRRTIASAAVSCVVAGEVGFAVQSGGATVWRAQPSGDPVLDVVALGATVVCRRNDCLVFNQDPGPVVYEAWASGSDPTELWEAQLTPIPLSRIWQCE